MKKYWRIFCALALACGLGGETASAQTINEEGRVAKTVWSGYWWPTAKQEILKPLAKYDQLTGARSAEWEKANNPPNVEAWVGLCHGWSAAAVMEEEPTARRSVNNVDLGVGDQKAWLSLAHGGDVANFYGLRFDGRPGDDPNDMAPEVLWEALRTTIGEQKTAIVLDIEPGAEVWNFPAYAYRVEAQKVGNVYRGKIYVWFADDHVAPDFVGVKRFVQAYPFEIGIGPNGTPLQGTGRWISSAKKSHPDFAWVPYVVRSGNDELSYEKVCELLGRTPQGGQAPEIAPETEAPTEDAVAENETPTEDAVAENEAPAEDAVAENDAPTEENAVAFSELEAFMQFVQEAGSDFDFDIRVKEMARELFFGDELVLTGISERAGYLTVVAIDPNGNLIPLYPQPGVDNRIEAKKEFSVPGEDADYVLRCTEPVGIHRIRAFVTERPIRFLADPAAASEGEGSKKLVDLNALTVRLTPAEKGMLVPEKREAKPFDLGKCAYDEALVYIGPKPAEAPETDVPEKKDEK